MAQPAKLTPARFGTVPRYYITTLNDEVIRRAKQKEMYTSTPVQKLAELARILSSIP
jgi:hypothetical protein